MVTIKLMAQAAPFARTATLTFPPWVAACGCNAFARMHAICRRHAPYQDSSAACRRQCQLQRWFGQPAINTSTEALCSGGTQLVGLHLGGTPLTDIAHLLG